MIKIKDTLNQEFVLLEKTCKDKNHFASRENVTAAVNRASKRFFGYACLRIQAMEDPSDAYFVEVTKKGRFLVLGCHSFTGAAKRTLLKWVGRKA